MRNQTLRNSFTVIAFTACACLFQVETINAQITFGEVKEVPKEISDWERYCIKELCATYDSSSFFVEPLPLIDAYRKYIGQQLFLLEVGYYDTQLIYTNPKNNRIDTDLYFPYYENHNYINIKEAIINKYYEIIDVIPYDKYPYLKEYGKKIHIETRQFVYNDSEGNRRFKYAPFISCFVLKETQSGDTVYTFEPEKFIIVGAFIKLKNEHIGKTFVNYIVSDNNEDLKLQSRWKCTDVTFIKNKPSFVLKNVDIESTEITLDCFSKFSGEQMILETYFDLKEGRQRRGEKYWALEQEFNKYSNELIAANKAQEKERQERQEQTTAAKAQRRQALITKYGQIMGMKVFNQEPEIGMTKAMFDDMNVKHWVVSTQKMETANGVAEVYVIRYGLNTCKRIVIIKQKIRQIDTYNCN
jgi:hypothetical protein